ncbi:MAG: hypothetical protein HJJLKODD_02362 [Phycisphaerae bacterium]|nr:hypothetical protein [Phycisphaerae bacterium]
MNQFFAKNKQTWRGIMMMSALVFATGQAAWADNPKYCQGGAGDGEVCTSGTQCDWGLCDGGSNVGEECQEDSECPESFCDVVDGSGICAGGEVNISGATLFDAFYRAPASTNDYIDADGDGVFTGGGIVDQLASTTLSTTWWLVNVREVGSGNGLAEFVRSHLEGSYFGSGPQWFPPCPPEPDVGLINRFDWTSAGDCTANPYPFRDEIHLGIMDVPTTWFVKQSGTTHWDRNPVETGYGSNSLKAWNANQSNALKSLSHPTDPGTYGSLNLNLASPDDRTVYDTPIAWVPIAIIGNRGVGIENVTKAQLQHLFVSGRLPSGENIVAATRDSGSGTRNGAMNSLGIDPSFGRGDNLDIKSSETLTITDNIGPDFQVTNMGGSSREEAAVQNSRLAIGYTGLSGSSRAIADAQGGKYEILSVSFDGTNYVRPNKDSVLLNCDPATGFLIGGNETFASVGDPGLPGSTVPAMRDGAAKDYLNNLTASIDAFITAPSDPANNGTPGEYLATQFSLAGALDCTPDPLNPDVFVTNPDYNPDLADWTYANQTGFDGAPAYGTANSKSPTRTASPTTAWPAPRPGDCGYPATGFYSDGTNGSSGYLTIHPGVFIGYNVNLNTVAPRSSLIGDFNGDGLRNVNDVPAMMAAYYDRYVLANPNFPTYAPLANSTTGNPVSIDIIGDFNGDGNFDCRDVRYFLDGLALNPASGKLTRQNGFYTADLKWRTYTGNDSNFFNTVIYRPNGTVFSYYAYGASRADVASAGASTETWPGAEPHGQDGRVDCTDAEYVFDNFGTWSNLEDAQSIDLSADMNNDLIVNCNDIKAVFTVMGGGSTNACPGLTTNCGTVPKVIRAYPVWSHIAPIKIEPTHIGPVPPPSFSPDPGGP